MNKRQVIRINENQLRQIVNESVKRVLKEEYQYKHNKEYQRLKNNANFTNDDARLADKMAKIPREISAGLSHLSLVLPDSEDMKLIGSPQRLSKSITDAIKLLLNNENTIIDAVMNTFSQRHHRNSFLDVDSDITNGRNIKDRYRSYYGHDIGEEPEYEPEKKPWDWDGE